MNRFIGVFATLALVSSLALAGENAGARPSLAVDGADGQAKDSYLEVRVDVGNLSGAHAVHFDLAYDVAGLEFVDFAEGDLYSESVVIGPVNRTVRGIVDVTIASATPARRIDESTVGFVRFRVIDPGRTDVNIAAFHTSDSNWEVDTQIDLTRGINVVPVATRLLGNSPNPFNPTTRIRYELPMSTHVSLQVLDVSGRVVRNLLSRTESAGAREVTWNGMNDAGRPVSSGVYFTRLQAGSEQQIKKMTLIR